MTERHGSRLATAFIVVCLAGSGGCGKDDEGPPPVLGIDESFFDRSTDPCTDFYQFACGTWIQEHPTDRASSVQRFFEGDGRNSYLLKKILEGDQNGQPYVPHASAQALGWYYGQCISSHAAPFVLRTNIDPFMGMISAVATLQDLASTLAKLHGSGIDGLFFLYSAIDPGNPTRAVMTFVPGGMSLPDRSYYLDPTMSVLPQYAEHIRRFVALYAPSLGIDPNDIVSVETALAGASSAASEARNPVARYNLLGTDAFTAVSSQFPWATYFQSGGYPAMAEINVTEPVYLMKLDELVASIPLETLKSYLKWRVLESYAHTLGASVVAEEANFHYGVFSGDATVPPDWWACLNSTRWAFGFELSQPFVAVRFDNSERDEARNLLGSIKQALGAELTTRAWLDGPTRDAAQAKLDKVRDKVGAPDAWPEPPTIRLSGGDYQWQVLEVSRWKAQRNLASLAEPIDRDAWSTPPCVTNAFYSPWKNEMVFPAAILQTPQFAVGRPDAINYGTIGSIMGHELTHGFDDYGRQFDGDGKLANWWTPEAASAFVGRATCLADQYSTYEPLPGTSIDGQATLGENIADLGGLRLAYAAYKARGSKDPFSGSYTGDQQFFLAYAQMQCANFRDELVRSSIRSDEHSPPKFRVNGVVANLPEFATAFACPAGSAMGPVDRCEVW